MLDALDEYSGETLDDILGLIHLFQISGIKVFCTSRPHICNLRDQLNTSIMLIDARDENVRNYLIIRLNKEWHHIENNKLRNKGNFMFMKKIVDRRS